MDEIKINAIFKFNNNQLAEVRKLFGYQDVNKLKQDIDMLEDWIKGQNHFVVKDFGRNYLERYLINHKGSVERAKQRLDKLCTLRNLMPEFTRNFDVKNEFIPLRKCLYHAFLPRPTKDNYRVVINKLHNTNDCEDLDFIHYYRIMIVITEYLLSHDYCAGLEVVIDARNITWTLMAKINPIIIHKALKLLIEGFGLRMKKIHLISDSKSVEVMMNLLKQGLSEKLSKRLIVHRSEESLYNYIPRDMFPTDYGGDEITTKELSDNLQNELASEEHLERIKFMETAITDEFRRITCKFHEEYSGMPGSFKTLCVD